MLRRQAADRKKNASENEGITVPEVLANTNIRQEDIMILTGEYNHMIKPLLYLPGIPEVYT